MIKQHHDYMVRRGALHLNTKGEWNMASVEFIMKRIEGKKKEIEKLEKKLVRISKAEASNWEDNPYYYSDYDKRIATKELEAAKKALQGYEKDLETAKEKEASRNVEAIIKFLEAWQDRMNSFYAASAKAYFKFKEDCHKEYLRLENKYGYYELQKMHYEGTYPYRELVYDCEEYREFDERRKNTERGYHFITPYIHGTIYESEKARKDIKKEADWKYDDIINRANAICGTITDATGLEIGDKGELNGIVFGTKGNARITTIGAGGYNIQCYHFRTLIHEVK